MGAPCCSSSSAVWSSSPAVGWHLNIASDFFSKGSKHISDGISEIWPVHFGPNWWDPRRLMAVRASCMRASGCTRLLPLGPSSCSNPFPFSLLPYHCGDKTGHGSKLHLTLQNRACPKWLHFTSCRWLSTKCNADNGGHETSLYTQTHFSPGPLMTEKVKITIISKVRISLVHLSK